MFCIKNKGFFSHKTYRKEILIEYLQCKIYILKKQNIQLTQILKLWLKEKQSSAETKKSLTAFKQIRYKIAMI